MATDNILIIDDEIEIGRVFERVATSLGYNTKVTTDPQEFMKVVKAKWPSHVLLDLQMPEIDGVELIRFLGEQKSKPQLIIASGFDARVVDIATELARDRGLAVAASLHKPVQMKELKSVLDQARTGVDLSKAALMRAIEEKELFLAYQPKLLLETGRVQGFEALVRWKYPQRGVVSPDEFVPAFEENNLFSALADYVAREACEALRYFDESGYPHMRNAINLSASDLSRLDVADRLRRICSSAGVSPNRLTVEITETVAMADPVAAMDNLARLRLAGLGVALDDFGTGFSSLAYLRKMPFDELKIDRVFVQNVLHSREDQAIIRAVVSLGRVFNMKVVAEGCEDAETMDLLAQLGCDVIQGYHISRPLELTAAIEFLRSWGEK